MDRIGCTLPDSDSYLGDEMQLAGTDALQMMNSVGPDRSSCCRNCASAPNALVKTRRHAPGHERPGQRVQLRLGVCFHVRRERFRLVLEEATPRTRELRPITI